MIWAKIYQLQPSHSYNDLNAWQTSVGACYCMREDWSWPALCHDVMSGFTRCCRVVRSGFTRCWVMRIGFTTRYLESLMRYALASRLRLKTPVALRQFNNKDITALVITGHTFLIVSRHTISSCTWIVI